VAGQLAQRHFLLMALFINGTFIKCTVCKFGFKEAVLKALF